MKPYGTVMFDGGYLVVSSTNSGAYGRYALGCPDNRYDNIRFRIGPGGLLLSNAVGSLRFKHPLHSAPGGDGGLHILNTGVLYLESSNTFTGGLHLYRHGDYTVAAIANDGVLGPVFATPTTNVFFHHVAGNEGSHVFFSDQDFTAHSNRLFHCDADTIARFCCNNTARMRIKGTIDGERFGDELCPTSTVTEVVSTWGGLVIFDPGADHTNFFGRLRVRGRAEIASGMNYCEQKEWRNNPGEGGTALRLLGNSSSFDDKKGRLILSGGTLKGSRYCTSQGGYSLVDNYGQLDVCGGTLDLERGELLNALNKAGRTRVSKGGVISAARIRVTQSSAGYDRAQLICATGGTFRCGQIYLDEVNAKSSKGEVILDGGTLEPSEASGGNFLGTGSATYNNAVHVLMRAGGVTFNADIVETRIRAPILTGVEEGRDGGLVKIGSKPLLLMTNCTYTGTTVVREGRMGLRAPVNTLPEGNTVVVYPEAHLDVIKGESGGATQTLARVEGSGLISSCSGLTVTDAVAPGVPETVAGTNGLEIGTLLFSSCPNLNGDFEIDGNLEGACDCLAVLTNGVSSSSKMDLSNLSIKVKDFETLNREKRYTIFTTGLQGYTGMFQEGNLATSRYPWTLLYGVTSVELFCPRGTVVIFR